MQFAAAALSSIAGAFTGGTAAAFGTGAAGQAVGISTTTAAAGAGLGGSFLSTILQGGATALSAMGAIRAANAKSDALIAQSQDATFDAKQEEIAGTERQTAMRRSLLQTIGERDVAYAAGGVDLTFGTPAVSRQQAIADTNSAVASDRSATETKAGRLRERAASLVRMADEARRSGRTAALGDALTFGAAVAKRG